MLKMGKKVCEHAWEGIYAIQQNANGVYLG
jgi:hypothetical protein